jgi:hypothetical protein
VPGTSSAESALACRWELHAGAGSATVEDVDSETRRNIGSDDALNVESWESDSQDVLYHAHWVAEGSFADTSSGLGGGPDQPALDQDINYPREYGSCPTFDDRDEVTESIHLDQLGGADISDSLVSVSASYTLVFRVHDRDC